MADNTFDPQFYAAEYPEVAASAAQSGTPLELHYQFYGAKQGFFPNAAAKAATTAAKSETIPQPFYPGGAQTQAAAQPGAQSQPSAGILGDWLNAARRSTQATNAMPYVMDPQSLSLNQDANKARIFPGAQAGMPAMQPGVMNPLLMGMK